MITELEALQRRLEERASEEYGELEIKWYPEIGFWLHGEPRWMGDTGDFLGEFYWKAKRSLDYILGYKPELVPTSLEYDIRMGRL